MAWKTGNLLIFVWKNRRIISVTPLHDKMLTRTWWCSVSSWCVNCSTGIILSTTVCHKVWCDWFLKFCCIYCSKQERFMESGTIVLLHYTSCTGWVGFNSLLNLIYILYNLVPLCSVRLADKPWLKVLLTDLLWEKNIICWLKKYSL